MKVVLGLGNPGVEYVNTRHNAGINLIDVVYSKQWAVDSSGYGWRRKKNIVVAEFPELILVKTAGYFMNESGQIMRDLKIDGFFNTPSVSPPNLGGEFKGGYRDFYLAHDDLDLRLGEYKIQFGKGPKVHNGVESVEKVLGKKEFWRIRIGIDNRPSENKIPGETYVLQRFNKEEKLILDGVLNKIVDEITETLVPHP